MSQWVSEPSSLCLPGPVELVLPWLFTAERKAMKPSQSLLTVHDPAMLSQGYEPCCAITLLLV